MSFTKHRSCYLKFNSKILDHNTIKEFEVQLDLCFMWPKYPTSSTLYLWQFFATLKVTWTKHYSSKPMNINNLMTQRNPTWKKEQSQKEYISWLLLEVTQDSYSALAVSNSYFPPLETMFSMCQLSNNSCTLGSKLKMSKLTKGAKRLKGYS